MLILSDEKIINIQHPEYCVEDANENHSSASGVSEAKDAKQPAQPKTQNTQPSKSEQRIQDAKTVSDVLQMAPIALDSYDDLFSDFDPSPYERRLLSEDLFKELYRRHNETPKGELMLTFTLPGSMRSDKIETLARKRIREHFRERLRKVERDIREARKNGIVRIVIGVFFEALMLSFLTLSNAAAISSFSVLSWYLIWSGLERLLEIPSKLSGEQAFVEKFAKAEYKFMNQEDLVHTITSLQAYL